MPNMSKPGLNTLQNLSIKTQSEKCKIRIHIFVINKFCKVLLLQLGYYNNYAYTSLTDDFIYHL